LSAMIVAQQTRKPEFQMTTPPNHHWIEMTGAQRSVNKSPEPAAVSSVRSFRAKAAGTVCSAVAVRAANWWWLGFRR
jgi:hypothetical protein